MYFINRNIRKINLSPFPHQLSKGLKVDDAVILGKQKEPVVQKTILDEGV